MDKFFKPAGDIEENNSIDLISTKDSIIKSYLLEIVSGTKTDNNVIGSGSMIISFIELQKMVEEDCYSFISAEYFNPEMIIIEYEKYDNENSNIIKF